MFNFKPLALFRVSDACNLRRGRRTSLPALSIVVAALLCGGCADRSHATGYSLRVAGAQIPVELLESWVRTARVPGFDLTRVDPIYLSKHGFDHLLAGDVDIACTDRPATVAELDDFRMQATSGEASPTPPPDAKTHARAKVRTAPAPATRPGPLEVGGHRIGFYGYALYAHPDNPLDSVYAGHLRYLFQKKVTTWKELGVNPDKGFDGPIRLIGPEKSTRGGNVLMRQANIWFAQPTWEPMPSDARIIEAVAADPLALGFAAIGLDRGVRYLGLRMERDALPAFPSLEEIESERYGLAKVIYIYYKMPPSPSVQALIDYLQSEAGRKAVEATDVWPIPRERSVIRHAP